MNRFLAMVFAMFATPFFLFAQTTGANPTSDYFGQDTLVQNACVDLRYNLIFRSRDARTNGEVSDLQDFLISNGYLSGEPTGYFGAVTLAAVRKFQLASGVGVPTTPGYGAIGPKSRAKIKAMTCGGAVAIESSLPATTLAQSPTTAIQTPPTTQVTTTTPLPFGCTPTTHYSPMTGAPCTPIAVVLPNGGEKLLKGTAIEILWAQPSSIDTEIRLLGYLSPACENLTATCDGNRTPAIYSIAKNPPIVIDKQRVYKWVVGDTRDINIGGATNNYVVPDGLYKIQVCFWTNTSKGCDSSDNYFSINSSQTTTTAQPITVTSPNGGETFAQGESLHILWKSVSPTQSVDVKILDTNGQVLSSPSPATNVTPANSNSQSLGFATSQSIIQTGLYKARVCSAGTNNCDDSDAYFKVIPPVTGVLPVLSNVSPQPVAIGAPLTIYVSGAGRSGNILLTTADGSKTWTNGYSIDNRILNGFALYDGSKMTITVPSTIGFGVNPDFGMNEPVVPVTNGTYKLYIRALDGNNNSIKSNILDVQIGTSGTTPVPTTSLPDLTIVGMRSDRAFSTAFANIDAINFSVDVKNNVGDVTTPFTVAIKVSGDAQYGAGGYFASNVIQGIRSGETKSVYIGSYLMPRGKELLGTITLIADYLGNVAESNEANNSIQKYLNIPALPTVISATPTSTTPSIPSIAITSPNGGEVLTVGQTKRITWNSSSVIDKVYIGYSFGTGSLNWIATNIPNTGYYDWNVNIGNTTNTQVKISITGYQTGTGSWSDQSDNFFTVNPVVSTPAPTVALTSSPSSIDKRISTSEILAIGLIASIEGPILSAQQYSAFTWELIGNAPVGVKLSVEGAFYAVLRGTPAQTGNYVFAIRLRNPGAPGVYTDIPVTLNVFSATTTTTPVLSYITARAYSPAGVPIYKQGDGTIIINGNGFDSTSSVYYYQNNVAVGGSNVVGTNMSVSSDGTKITVLPITLADGTYQIKVGNNTDPATNPNLLNLIVSSLTPAPTVTFTASPASITSGQTSILSWSSTNATSCTSSGDGASWGWPSARYITGAQYTPALTATQTFTMSCTGSGGTTSKSVTVTVAVAPTTVTSTPTIKLLSPNGGETIAQNSQYTVQWNTSNYAATTLINMYLFSSAVTPPTETSYNAGFVSTLVSSTPNDGSEAVTIPSGLAGTTYFIRVLGRDMTPTGTAFPNGCLSGCRNDDSDAPFTISAASTQSASVIGALSGLSTTSNAPLWKYTWTRNLEVGSPYSDDITALQTALIKEGVYTGEITGGFYSQTYLAVRTVQAKYGIEATGFFGPETRAKLNSIYGN